jgi:hypothetical protein
MKYYFQTLKLIPMLNTNALHLKHFVSNLNTFRMHQKPDAKTLSELKMY